LGTGREQHITITASANLSKDDIEKAIKEAEKFAAEDAKRKDEADTRNHADQMVYQSEKTLADMGDKIEADDKSNIEQAIEKVKTAMSGTDTQTIKDAVSELEKAFYAASEKLYSQVNPQGDAQGPNGGDPSGGNEGGNDYYDADYEVVEDDNDN